MTAKGAVFSDVKITVRKRVPETFLFHDCNESVCAELTTPLPDLKSHFLECLDKFGAGSKRRRAAVVDKYTGVAKLVEEA